MSKLVDMLAIRDSLKRFKDSEVDNPITGVTLCGWAEQGAAETFLEIINEKAKELFQAAIDSVEAKLLVEAEEVKEEAESVLDSLRGVEESEPEPKGDLWQWHNHGRENQFQIPYGEEWEWRPRHDKSRSSKQEYPCDVLYLPNLEYRRIK